MNAERALLQQLIAGPATGDALAHASGQTRAAVWKRIEALREAGLEIEARAGRGYALVQPLDLLDPGAILAALPPARRDGIAGLDVAWSTESTNSDLLHPLDRATPLPDGVRVLLAERQTGGRGRRGRSWASPLAANLYLSCARRFEGGLARLGGLGLVAGVAVAEALRSIGLDAVCVKWPNDLVVGDGDGPGGGLRKLGGILVEGGGEHGGPVRAVIGLGLNVRMPSAYAARIDQPWTDLAALMGDRVPTRNALAAVVLAHLLDALDAFDRDGLAPFLPRFAAVDALLQRDVVVHGGDVDHSGIALGLASDGALRVRLPDGERRFHAGDVSVRAR